MKSNRKTARRANSTPRQRANNARVARLATLEYRNAKRVAVWLDRETNRAFVGVTV